MHILFGNETSSITADPLSTMQMQTPSIEFVSTSNCNVTSVTINQVVDNRSVCALEHSIKDYQQKNSAATHCFEQQTYQYQQLPYYPKSYSANVNENEYESSSACGVLNARQPQKQSARNKSKCFQFHHISISILFTSTYIK